MYIDNILAIISFFLLFGGISELFVYLNSRKTFSLKTLLIVRKVAKIIAYLFFTVLVFLTTFFKIKFVGTALCIYVYSISLFLYTLMDVFYSQVKKDEYIVELQKQLIRTDAFKDLFEIVEYRNAVYKITKQDEHQIYGIVDTENHGICIGSSREKILYKPKVQLSRKYLQFYARYFEIVGFEIPIFKNEEEFEEYLSYFQLIKPNKFYYWMKKHERKIKIGLLVILVLFLLVFIILMILQYFNLFNLDGWLSKELN